MSVLRRLDADRKIWKYRDIDGRKLTFKINNRPARRFLYILYTLAWLRAEDKSWVGSKDKVPPGEVWASPNKPDGYLRVSVLLALGKRTGDRISASLINTGISDDPSSSSVVADEFAGIKIAETVQDHLGEEREAD